MTKDEIVKVVQTTVQELQRVKFSQNKKLSPFQITEIYISQYKNMDESIQLKLDTIDELRNEAATPKINRLVPDIVQGGIVENISQLEKREEVINHLLKEIEEITVLKLQIEKLMDKFKDREDFRIIKEKYFNDKTNEEIGDMLNIDESTVRRRKNKIINDMSKILFPLSAGSVPKVRLEISE